MSQFIINFLISLKNASFSKKEELNVPYSEYILQIIKNLYNDGFIQSFKIIDNNVYIVLRYFFNKSILKGLKLVSTPSKSRYLSFKALTKLSTKKFVLYVSTNKGILTLSQCKKLKIGGVALFYC
jgi:small subunit ribosomal protein S8